VDIFVLVDPFPLSPDIDAASTAIGEVVVVVVVVWWVVVVVTGYRMRGGGKGKTYKISTTERQYNTVLYIIVIE
jgi:hypothetical protein